MSWLTVHTQNQKEKGPCHQRHEAVDLERAGCAACNPRQVKQQTGYLPKLKRIQHHATKQTSQIRSN